MNIVIDPFAPLQRTTQDGEDGAECILDGACPFIPSESLWNGVWDNTSDKSLDSWMEGTLTEVFCGQIVPK